MENICSTYASIAEFCMIDFIQCSCGLSSISYTFHVWFERVCFFDSILATQSVLIRSHDATSIWKCQNVNSLCLILWFYLEFMFWQFRSICNVFVWKIFDAQHATEIQMAFIEKIFANNIRSSLKREINMLIYDMGPKKCCVYICKYHRSRTKYAYRTRLMV